MVEKHSDGNEGWGSGEDVFAIACVCLQLCAAPSQRRFSSISFHEAHVYYSASAAVSCFCMTGILDDCVTTASQSVVRKQNQTEESWLLKWKALQGVDRLDDRKRPGAKTVNALFGAREKESWWTLWVFRGQCLILNHDAKSDPAFPPSVLRCHQMCVSGSLLEMYTQQIRKLTRLWNTSCIKLY